MKFLFICEGNVCRSQIAEAFFKEYCKNKNYESFSAGTKAEKYQHRKLGTYAISTVACMKEFGIDLSEQEAKQLTPKMVDGADRIFVIMNDRATCPDYLVTSDKVEYWEVEDPAARSHEHHSKTRDSVRKYVLSLISKLEKTEKNED